MYLQKITSLCAEKQRIIVSEENGRKHIANNANLYVVKHFHIDRCLQALNVKLCDFLLLCESVPKSAYLIELKGRALLKAVQQLISTEEVLKADLNGYNLFYRVVTSKTRTHEINASLVQKFMRAKGMQFKYKTHEMKEDV